MVASPDTSHVLPQSAIRSSKKLFRIKHTLEIYSSLQTMVVIGASRIMDFRFDCHIRQSLRWLRVMEPFLLGRAIAAYIAPQMAVPVGLQVDCPRPKSHPF